MFLLRTFMVILALASRKYCHCSPSDSCCMCLRTDDRTFYQTQALAWNSSNCWDRNCISETLGISLPKEKAFNSSRESPSLYSDLESARNSTLPLDSETGDKSELAVKRVGFWMEASRSKRLGFETTFVDLCRKRGMNIIPLNFSRPLDELGPFDAIVQDTTTLVAAAATGNLEAHAILQSLEDFDREHKETVFVDPVSSARNLCNRTIYYNILKDLTFSNPNSSFFIPNFTILEKKSDDLLLKQLNETNVHFPLVCKPQLAHGNEFCHEMTLIFNNKSLKDLQLPCIAQQFINHNSVLYKVYVMGKKHFITNRPSIKNLDSGDHKTIFFKTDDVSKHYSKSPLSQKNYHSVEGPSVLNDALVTDMVHTIRKRLGLTLFGIDVIVNESGRMAVIDVNYFPGYHCIDSAMEDLADHIKDMLSTET